MIIEKLELIGLNKHSSDIISDVIYKSQNKLLYGNSGGYGITPHIIDLQYVSHSIENITEIDGVFYCDVNVIGSEYGKSLEKTIEYFGNKIDIHVCEVFNLRLNRVSGYNILLKLLTLMELRNKKLNKLLKI